MNIKITSHITLQPLSFDHCEKMLVLINENREHLSNYLYWVDDVKDLISCSQYINQRIGSRQPHAQWYAINFEGKLSGVFAIKLINEEGIAELGYWLSHQATGNGIINKIVAQATTLLKGTPANTIEFCCLDQNHASISVALKSGAKFSHQLDDYMVQNGQHQSLRVYRKTL